MLALKRAGKRKASEKKAAAEPVDAKRAKSAGTSASDTALVVTSHEKPGHVFCVGQGDVGQLGLGPDIVEKARPALIPGLEDVVTVVCGGMHTLCLTKTGQVFSFGCNDEGALGRKTSSLDGSETKPAPVELPEPISEICAGDSHSAALAASGAAYVWGNFRDSSGAMGLVTSGKPEMEPVHIADNIVQIASGSDHLVLLSSDGVLLTLGCAEQGQLGRVSRCFVNRGGRKGISFLLKPQKVTMRRPRGCRSLAFDRVWAGSYTTFARLRDTGDVYGFGLNNFHQMGALRENSREDQDVHFMPCLLTSCLGHRWQKISGGQHHTLLLDEEGGVFAMGRKEYGRLGLGPSCDDQSSPQKLQGLPRCSDVSCGNVVSFAVTTEGQVYSWGFGTNGQLGHGDEEDVFEPKVMSGKLISSKKAFQVSGGGQHAAILATDT